MADNVTDRYEIRRRQAAKGARQLLDTQLSAKVSATVSAQASQTEVAEDGANRPAAGALLGHYQVRAFLGAGGFGDVFEAWDTLLCRSVALKRLRTDTGPHDDRLIREARLAASLRHPAFIKIFALHQDAKGQSIVMELVPGATLRDHAAQEWLEPGRATAIVGEVADAMMEAHASGLVHGDLKPSNLMVEPSGAIRILDFGLARQVDPFATQSVIAQEPQGTVAYMAPERLQGHPPDQAGDIYALGVIYYELLTGARPFADLHGLALAAALLHSSSDHWPFDGPAAAAAPLIRAMTARDVDKRIATMAEVLRRLDGRTAARPAARPPARRWRQWAGVAFAAVLAVAAVGVREYLPLAGQSADTTSASAAQSLEHGFDALRYSDRETALDTAVADFTRVLEERPRHAAAMAGLSIAYALRYVGDDRDETWLKRAGVGARQALQYDDQLALAHTAQAWALAIQGDAEGALTAAERALSLDPADRFALHIKVSTLLRKASYAQAATTLKEAMARFPAERTFADLLGTMHYQQADFRQAEQAFRRSLALEPNAVFAYANLSATLLRLNRNDEALQVLQQGLRIQPNGMLYNNLGTALFARGDYAGAAQAFQNAVSAAKGGPNDYLKWANLADALRWVPGRATESRQAYLRATQLLAPLLARTPDDPTFLSRMGLFRAHLDDPGDALELVERAATLAPNNYQVAYRAAVASELAGRRDSALAHLRRALALGFPAAEVAVEPDLIALRRDIRYQTLHLESAK